MIKTIPKTPELIQAQLATFAAERISQPEDARHIYGNLGHLAVGELSDITRVTDATEYHKSNGNRPLRVPAGVEHTVATAADYTDFLRSVGGSRYEAIQGRVDMLQGYGRFEPIVTQLKSELADPATRAQHPNLLGSGSYAMVFSVTVDGKPHAVRVPKGPGIHPGVIDGHLAGAVLGKGVPHLEQIVAASYEDGVTVAEIMPGKEMGQLTGDEIRGISDDKLAGLADTISVMNERGIAFDPKPSNVLYDAKEGFGVVDYHPSEQSLGVAVGFGATAITNAGFYGNSYRRNKTIEDYSHDLNLNEANLDVLERYRAIVEQKLSGEAQETALKFIDVRLSALENSIKLYSDPEWVAADIAERKHRKERAKQPAPDDDEVL